MPPTLVLWRICADTPGCPADDVHGLAAAAEGGRWNPPGVPLLYGASSRALACLESLAHLDLAQPLPADRWLIEYELPPAAWEARAVFAGDPNDAKAARRWGAAWARQGGSLLAWVPSVIVPEEGNGLVNPRHASAGAVRARRVRRWRYDLRLGD